MRRARRKSAKKVRSCVIGGWYTYPIISHRLMCLSCSAYALDTFPGARFFPREHDQDLVQLRVAKRVEIVGPQGRVPQKEKKPRQRGFSW
jgi:hypothetical protein